MVFISAQEEYHKKKYSLDIIDGRHVEKYDSNDKTKESWAALDEEKTSKSDWESALVFTSKSFI